jgi:hypothetical protein
VSMIIQFKKGGKVTMTPTGYPGEACTKMTAHYRKHMAGDVKSDRPTEEMYEEGQGQTNAPVKQTEKA